MINENTGSKIMKLTSGGIVFKLKREHDTIRMLYDYGSKETLFKRLEYIMSIWHDIEWFRINRSGLVSIKQGYVLVRDRDENVIYDNR